MSGVNGAILLATLQGTLNVRYEMQNYHLTDKQPSAETISSMVESRMYQLVLVEAQ